MLETKLPSILRALGIAAAEGYFDRHNLPYRLCNPGDLICTDPNQCNVLGKRRYPSHRAGWLALFQELELIDSGTSHAGYKPTMTIAEVAYIWTGADQPGQWALTVAAWMNRTIADPFNPALPQKEPKP